MEIHVALCAAVPNSTWVEFIPQLDVITESGIEIVDGYAVPSSDIGLGISWDWKAIERTRIGHAILAEAK
jgi:L-alanine-DL-glutamate epimerase-like enolase superfamily enzyme